MSTQIIKCRCRHEYQDQLYGRGNRVHNPVGNGSWTCTVCGLPHTVEGAAAPENKKSGKK